MVSGHGYSRYKQDGVQMRRPLQLRSLLPITIASLPTTQKHFDWAGFIMEIRGIMSNKHHFIALASNTKWKRVQNVEKRY